MIVAQQKMGTLEALQEMSELLRSVAKAGTPHRLSAVRYTHCRAVLLESEVRTAVPGFLVQCVSIYKFHDFINLYDPKAELRIQFVDAALQKCRDLLGAKRVFDVFNDDF
jgi:hypothetical protein